MKKLAQQLLDFLRVDFDPVVYAGTAVWLAVLLTANYGFDAFDFVDRDSRNPARILVYAAFYGIPWLVVHLLQRARGRVDLGQHPSGAAGFHRMAAFALFVVAFTDWFPFHRDLADLAPRAVRGWAQDVLWNLKSTVCWFSPMFLWWWLVDRREDRTLYGCTLKGFDVRPYATCLSVVIPLVVWASFQPAFLDTYPTYRPGSAEPWLGVHPLVTVLPYELVYGFDFTFVELYFRGFLVIGMARWLGPNAVLPMVATYAVLHFGKPLPETIGSILGGWVLGVFALNSRSIAGGVMLHLGLAWSMEAAAFVQHARAGGSIDL